jgi:hypothetical protein
MARSPRDGWMHQLEKDKIDYVFRAYVRCTGGGIWAARHRLLCLLAQECGPHREWSETVFVDGDRQQWIIWAFKDHALKLKFEAGVPQILARQFVPRPDEGTLPIAQPDYYKMPGDPR